MSFERAAITVPWAAHIFILETGLLFVLVIYDTNIEKYNRPTDKLKQLSLHFIVETKFLLDPRAIPFLYLSTFYLQARVLGSCT